jgi:PAS domain S-box-containing protein
MPISKKELEKLNKERRSFNRFEIQQQSIEIEVIVEGYKKLPGISILNNISLGGINIQIKEPVKPKTQIKFRLGKSKTLFHAVVAWCRESNVESYPHSIGVSFIFPFEKDAAAQQRELLQFVIKTLNKMPKAQLVDRLIELFIERRKIFDAAQEKIEEANLSVKNVRGEAEALQDQTHSILEKSLTGVMYISKDNNILFTNKVADDILGYSQDDLSDLKISNIAQESTGKMLKRYFDNKNDGVYNGAIFDKGGEEIPISWRVLPLKKDGNDLICFMFIKKD